MWPESSPVNTVNSVTKSATNDDDDDDDTTIYKAP